MTRSTTVTIPGILDSKLITRKRTLVALGLLLLGCCIFIGVRGWQASAAARAGRADLQQAAAALRAQQIDVARAEFAAADSHFDDARGALHGMGPLLPAARTIPMARVQVRGLETMIDVGRLLATAGSRLTDATAMVLDAKDDERPLSDSLGQLKGVERALQDAVSALGMARQRTEALDGYRLLGPLGSTRSKLKLELADAEPRAARAYNGLRLLLWMLGADRPTRLFVFSQNPDEVRPTGGYIGTYGVMEGRAGRARLLSYNAMGSWVQAHPKAVVPVEKAPTPFGYATPPQPQQLANVNSSPDWPSAARLAQRLWERGGEQPVNGAVSLMPQTLARITRVLGPVRMPAYGETITADNLVARLDYYTHREAIRNESSAVRKQFITDLAPVIVKRLLSAPSDKWLRLGGAMSASFDAREAMMWTDDPSTNRALRSLGWSGELPEEDGDFYADSEFEYTAKNGAALKRTFNHVVRLNADGSGTASTTMVLRNTAPAEPFYNDDSLSYITAYGPVGGVLDEASERPDANEPTLKGHPAAGYFRAAEPLGSMRLRVVWGARFLALPRTDGSLLYRLEFRGHPGHTGDILHLQVHPPQGWRWDGPPPPANVALAGSYRGEWVLRH
jgi:hypothetical protein